VPALARPTYNLTVPVSVGGLSPRLSFANADGARRPARSAGYPWLLRAEPVPPGRLHSSTGLPYLISRPRFLEGLCLRTDRITPGPLWLQGRPNSRPVVFTSRSLRSGMGLSEPLAGSSCDDSAFCSRKFSFAACSGLQATPGPSGGSEPPGRHPPLPGLTRYRHLSLLRRPLRPGVRR